MKSATPSGRTRSAAGNDLVVCDWPRQNCMTKVDRCVVCEEPIFARKAAIVSPFLARRIWNRKPMAVELAECPVCGFLFFNPRLEPEEERRLYAGYREPAYQAMRHSCEPWYTPGFNASLSHPRLMETRREALAPILRAHLTGLEKPRILDFGGDRGQLVRDILPNAPAYTYDISGVQPLDGVGLCRNPAECKALQADLVVCSNVLEHVGFPRTIMDEITALANPQTRIFVEVPCETPFGARLILRRVIQYGILTLTRPGVMFSAARAGFLYPMHEHINYFTLQSLKTLVVESGWEVAAAGEYVLGGALGGKMIWCLGSRAQRAGTMGVCPEAN